MRVKLLILLLLILTVCHGQRKKVPPVQPTFSGSAKTSALDCNSWLSTPLQGSFVNIGKLNIAGNQVTVEASAYRTSFMAAGSITDGDLVSKHSGPNDANYILRTTGALITTSDGFFATPDVCTIELNKLYHYAMVYDGATLKFYRNGFLMSQVPATGTLYQNNWNTQIGLFDPGYFNENFIGYMNEVRIWNVARTQAQIRAYMDNSLPAPATQPGLQAYYIFNDLTNKQGNPAWNGSLSGAAAINTTVPGCTFIADSCDKIVAPPCSQKEDFNYTINVCNPLSVTLQSSAIVYDSIRWTLDDGTLFSGTTNPSHAFASAGNHSITMIVDNATCSDTVTKKISLDVLPDDSIILTLNTTLCAGNTLQLHTSPSLAFCWSPVTYLDNPNAANPVSAATQDITYYFTASKQGKNLITNGDFSSGNTGFTSDYQFANPNLTEGQYFVGANPSVWNPGMDGCHGHTTGNDNMMLVNGAPVPGVNVWKQTVNVVPNTNYAFSTWVQALWTPNPAQLQFSINGNEAGSLISASLPTCTWTQFYTTWNSGNNTSADISIVNVNTAIQGNDFALDDISFAPVTIVRDSVSIKISKPSVKAFQDTVVCAGKPVQLNASSLGVNATYQWTPAAGLSNPALANPIATVTSNTQFTVTAAGADGCTAKDSVLIAVIAAPVITKTPDTTICHDKTIQLLTGGGNTYSWLPSSTLSNTGIANPVASPVVNTTYYLTVTNTSNCSSSDSIRIKVKQLPVFSVSTDATDCIGTPVQLNAAGGDVYTWQPANALSNAAIANPLATPTVTTQYLVRIKESTCNDTASLLTTVTVLPLPVVQASRSNDIDCTKPASQLNATGAASYLWQPSAGLNDSAIAAPLASAAVTTLYVVKGTDASGCSNYDSVSVLVTHTGDLLVNLPNAFSPNGDGRNDCFGVSRYAGLLQRVQLSVYDRFGVRVFYTTNALNCWDGRYKGKLQDAGGFVYVLKASTFCGEIFKKGMVMLLK